MTESFGSGSEQFAVEEFPVTSEHVEAADVSAPPAPNGFALMGLAPELVAATTDLGYT